MIRLAMVPAAVCLVAAVLLGAWGWSERDASRLRASTERAEQRERTEIDFRDSELEREDLLCRVLGDAAALRPPADSHELFGYDAPVGPSVATTQPNEIDTAWLLVGVLSTDETAWLPRLDSPRVAQAIEGLRTSLEAALASGDQPLGQPDVRDAADRLAIVLEGVC